MKIFDLNHLETVEGTDVIGGGRYKGGSYGVRINKNVRIKFDEDFNVDKNINSDADISDNVAIIEGDAEAYGKSTLTEVFGFTTTVQNKYSGSSLTSISASDE